jgi:hypothetical protein
VTHEERCRVAPLASHRWAGGEEPFGPDGGDKPGGGSRQGRRQGQRRQAVRWARMTVSQLPPDESLRIEWRGGPSSARYPG